MIGLILKPALALASLIFTVFLFYTGSWGWGIVFIFVTGFFALFIFRNEHLLMATLQMRQQNTEKAKKYLARIRQPQFLMRGQRAYYYYLMALASGQSIPLGQSESLLRKALSIGLRQQHDQAMAKMNLAVYCLQTGRRRECETLLAEVKKLDTKGLLTDYIKDIKRQIGKSTSQNQMRMAQMSKGRKTKMR